MSFQQELIKLHGGTLEIESVTAEESKDGSRKFYKPAGLHRQGIVGQS